MDRHMVCHTGFFKQPIVDNSVDPYSMRHLIKVGITYLDEAHLFDVRIPIIF